MRHNNAFRKLGRDSAHRIAMINNLSKSLIDHGKINTTLHRAKELRRYVEKIITISRIDTIHNRRNVFARLRDETLIKKLFTEVSPKYIGRPGGYTRIVKTGVRLGDGAKTARIELV